MPATPPKGPPKFVPTLTDVVQVSGEAVPGAGPAPESPGQAAGMASGAAPSEAADLLPHTVFSVMPGPQSDVPTHAASATPAGAPPSAASPAGPAASAPIAADFSGIEEMVIHRIIQRVDVVLDQRLREAIATVVQEQTRSMVPRLREEVESVVRHAVYEAVADELAGPGGPQR